ncbi:MAG: replication-relaxation family protein [Actinomycetota bacterium]|nr:replication-relaxation family protein [Actinomycetota bacterium]
MEVDMGTETLERIRGKIVAYREYWKSGKFKDCYSYRNFRVLTVITYVQRLDNLIEAAHQTGAKICFCFYSWSKSCH